MTLFQALLLGIIQGITEFFPVSSSGHLKIAQLLFGFSNLKDYLFFDLTCHLGTLLAILIFFYRDLLVIIRSERGFIYLIAYGTLPLLPLYFLLSQIRAIFNAPQYLGFFFLLTAVIIFIGAKFRWRKEVAAATETKPKKIYVALIIGVFQALAILPGISRSGATISAAKFLGWSDKQAIRFSFLLAIPAICGGMLIEIREIAIGKEIVGKISHFHYIIGSAASFTIGIIALACLVKIVNRGKITVFAWYCLLLGIATIVML